MSGPDIDPVTAESMAQDADFASEHTRPTFSDEPCTEGPDESVPTGLGGMDLRERRRKRRSSTGRRLPRS